MPKTWNGDLVVFAHGGPSVVPPTANGSKADLTKYAIAVKRGFGWVASSYRREGYGVGMAGQDSDNARRFFVERIAKPRHTYLHGASYGGLVGAAGREPHQERRRHHELRRRPVQQRRGGRRDAQLPASRRPARRLSIRLQEPAATGRGWASPRIPR
jgi:hypothetical protein